MAEPRTVENLLNRHPIISEQVNRAQLNVILHELSCVLERKIAGDIVEFGCYIGTTSLFIRRLLDEAGSDKSLHVYDSFEGLPLKSAHDASRAGEQFVAGQLSASKKAFLQQFQRSNLRPPVIHKGWFGELNSADVPGEIAFAFLDGDFYESIRDSLELVLPKLSRGATLIVDDYSREALPGAAKAVHEFLPPNLRSRLRTESNLAIICT